MQRVLIGLLLSCSLALFGNSCRYIDKPRPVVFRCYIPQDTFLLRASEVLDRNGYSVVSREKNMVVGHDTITNVSNGYRLLVRQWEVIRDGDSVVVFITSLQNRMDDSDVAQTWDRRQSGLVEKEWMRPVMTSLEAICGTGNPLQPGAK